jgi:Outer membrane efflux protein
MIGKTRPVPDCAAKGRFSFRKLLSSACDLIRTTQTNRRKQRNFQTEGSKVSKGTNSYDARAEYTRLDWLGVSGRQNDYLSKTSLCLCYLLFKNISYVCLSCLHRIYLALNPPLNLRKTRRRTTRCSPFSDFARSFETPKASSPAKASKDRSKDKSAKTALPALTALAAFFFAAGCSVGLNYRRAAAPVPVTYKELKGWKAAAPNDTINRGAWWSIYRDPTLNGLEWQIDISNQNIKQFEAAYREARAQIREQQSSFFPSLSVTPQIDRQKSNRVIRTSYTLEGNATWEPDVWGKVRRNVESSVANAQATAAELAATRLSAQAQLAIDYFELRYADSLKDLLDETVKGFQRSLQITQNQ